MPLPSARHTEPTILRPMIRASFCRALSLGALALASCSPTPRYVINAPAPASSIVCSDPAGVSCNVPANVQWDGVSVRPHPEATLDGATVTTPFTTSGNASVLTLVMPVGTHTFVVSGDLAAKGTIASYSATSTFNVTAQPPPPTPVGSFTLSASPNAIVVERGKFASTTITVTRVAPFTGGVAIAASSPVPTGVTVSGGPVGTGTMSAPLTINVSPAATIGKVTLNLTGTAIPGPGMPPPPTPGPASVSIALTIGRETGAFQEANPTPYLSTLPSTVNALSGAFSVQITVGQPSVPQPRKAQFFRGAQAVGNEIGFTLGPVTNLGGAGFCNNGSTAAITRGVVLSGQMPGFASQNVVTFLDVTVNSPSLVQAPTDANVQQTQGGPFILFQPRVFFSRDCTLALVAGANKLGPSRHILHIYNLITGQPIGNDVSFETNIFSALVRTTAAAKQEVEVKVDTGAPSAQTVVIPIP